MLKDRNVRVADKWVTSALAAVVLFLREKKSSRIFQMLRVNAADLLADVKAVAFFWTRLTTDDARFWMAKHLTQKACSAGAIYGIT